MGGLQKGWSGMGGFYQGLALKPLKKICLFYEYECLSVCTSMCILIFGGQGRVLDPLEFELPIISFYLSAGS